MLKIKDIRPTFTKIITTAERYAEDTTTGSGVLLDSNKLAGNYKEYQKVLRIGSAVREVKEGEMVLIDPTRYIRRKYSENSLRDDFDKNPIESVNIPTVEMNGQECFWLDQNDIAYVITDYEETTDNVGPTLIKPKEVKIQL